MVVGLLVLGVLFIYAIFSLVIIRIGIHTARDHGKAGWKGGLVAFLVMYHLMFWDLIPMRVAHRYYCASEGGFTVYKSLEQWKAENPGVAETLEPAKNAKWITEGDRTRVQLNQRFVWDTYTTREFMDIRKRDERIVDAKTGEILAQYVDFDDGLNARNPERLRDFKMWLGTGSCEQAGKNIPKRKFNEIYHLFKYQEGIDL